MGTVTSIRVHARDGFSLIELLVVIGLIAILAGAIGLALGDAGGNSLATAQKTVATMIGSARAQAAVTQQETILAIYGTRPPAGDYEKYMRLMQVFRNENTDTASARWVPVGNPVSLPRGVFIVPPAINGLLSQGTVWPSNPPLLSTLGNPIALGQPAGTPFGGSATAFILQFDPDGTLRQVGSQPHARVVIATAVLSAAKLPQFNNAGAVRGVLIRPTGAVTSVDVAVGF